MKWQLSRSRLASSRLVTAIIFVGVAPVRAHAEEAPVAMLASITLNRNPIADPALVFKLAQDQVCIPVDVMVRLGISSEGLPVRAVEGERCFVLGPANGMRHISPDGQGKRSWWRLQMS